MKRRPEFHDTEALPPGGFFFAPGAIDDEPRPGRYSKDRQRWRVAYPSMVLVAIGVGLALAALDWKGWLL